MEPVCRTSRLCVPGESDSCVGVTPRFVPSTRTSAPLGVLAIRTGAWPGGLAALGRRTPKLMDDGNWSSCPPARSQQAALATTATIVTTSNTLSQPGTVQKRSRRRCARQTGLLFDRGRRLRLDEKSSTRAGSSSQQAGRLSLANTRTEGVPKPFQRWAHAVPNRPRVRSRAHSRARR